MVFVMIMAEDDLQINKLNVTLNSFFKELQPILHLQSTENNSFLDPSPTLLSDRLKAIVRRSCASLVSWCEKIMLIIFLAILQGPIVASVMFLSLLEHLMMMRMKGWAPKQPPQPLFLFNTELSSCAQLSCCWERSP